MIPSTYLLGLIIFFVLEGSTGEGVFKKSLRVYKRLLTIHFHGFIELRKCQMGTWQINTFLK